MNIWCIAEFAMYTSESLGRGEKGSSWSGTYVRTNFKISGRGMSE